MRNTTRKIGSSIDSGLKSAKNGITGTVDKASDSIMPDFVPETNNQPNNNNNNNNNNRVSLGNLLIGKNNNNKTKKNSNKNMNSLLNSNKNVTYIEF